MMGALYQAIDALLAEKRRVIIAIDGNSGAGKSTLAKSLASRYSANVLHMDDFFLPIAKKTAQRLGQPGGNVDHERFYTEVYTGLKSGGAFSYRPFDCQGQVLMPPVKVQPSPVSIIEGVYSLRPELRDLYNLKVFLKLNETCQRERILARSGSQLLERFLSEWIPLENAYFDAFAVPACCEMVINGDSLE